MPVVRITMLKGKPPEYVEAISNGVARALVEAYEVREGDRFHIIDEYEPGRLIFDRNFAGGPRSDDFLIVSITAGARTREVKEAFYRRLADTLAAAPGVRPEDLMILVSATTAPEDLSFGKGESAAALLERITRERANNQRQ
jgi:phenylpyruvate tautomerase PptA (4-oxalocrotonate tautomerase family)